MRERGADHPPRSDSLLEGLFPSVPIIILSAAGYAAAGSVSIEEFLDCRNYHS